MEDASTTRPKPLMLLILDGYGIAPDDNGNAITRAKTPVMDALIAKYPAMTLRASGEAVGLNWGEMGNSEVGHLTMGAGRVYWQSQPRINREIENGNFFQNEVLLNAMKHVKESKGTLHIGGILSDGGVHGLNTHIYAIMEMAKKNGVKRVAIHAILDGRDTLYNVGYGFVEELLAKIKEIGVGELASLSGRFYAMDRDNKWDRTQKAYNAIVRGEGEKTEDPLKAIKESYAKEIYDEQFPPTVITEKDEPVATLKEGDSFIFTNFRADRARQLTKALSMPTFDSFPRDYIDNLNITTMTEYEKDLPVEVAYKSEMITKGLSEIISNTGLKQLHAAETEKYAHVTFFFNGTREEPFPGEERLMIPSPKVASYDETPAMSVPTLTEKLLKEIKTDNFDVYIVNFASPDMVAHTGNMEATVKAIEAADTYMGKLAEAVIAKNGVMVITADHGNAEEMSNLTTGDMDKEHSTNAIPLVIAGKKFEGKQSLIGEIPGNDLSLVSPIGVIADVAPTCLHILGIPKPEGMTGQSLIV